MLYQLSYRPIFWISGEKRNKRYQFPNRSASDIFSRAVSRRFGAENRADGVDFAGYCAAISYQSVSASGPMRKVSRPCSSVEATTPLRLPLPSSA